MTQIEKIVARIESGDVAAAEELLPLVYDELKLLASRRLAKEPSASMQTTELVHEAYLRLVGPNAPWDGRAHFFAAAAEGMRRILIDRARRKQRLKHGGDQHRVGMRDSAIEADSFPAEILVVNDLFDVLTKTHPKEAEVAKLRYFAGLSMNEIADALDISVGSVHNYWKFARAWLYREYTKE